MHKNNFKKIIVTLLLSLVLSTSTSGFIEINNTIHTCSEDDDTYMDSTTKD